jgi:DNA primase
VLNEPYLAPCEKDLLRFVLEDGCSELKFDMDSRYYIEGDQVNVAEFIDGILADDDAEFANQSYRKVYNAYFELYDEGLSQLQIQTRLMNSTDQEIAAVAKELLIEKYQITVKNYEQSLTAASTILVQYVPKTLLVYQCKKVELLMKQLTKELAGETDPERQVELLAKISDYTRARARLHNELGRV